MGIFDRFRNKNRSGQPEDTTDQTGGQAGQYGDQTNEGIDIAKQRISETDQAIGADTDQQQS